MSSTFLSLRWRPDIPIEVGAGRRSGLQKIQRGRRHRLVTTFSTGMNHRRAVYIRHSGRICEKNVTVDPLTVKGEKKAEDEPR